MATRKNLLSLLGMFHCTFSNNWPKLATLADNGARTNEHKAQRTKGAKKHQLPKGGATFPVEGWCGWVRPWVVGGGGGWGCYPCGELWLLLHSSFKWSQRCRRDEQRWRSYCNGHGGQQDWMLGSCTSQFKSRVLPLDKGVGCFLLYIGLQWGWVEVRQWTKHHASGKVDHTNSTTHGVGHTALYPSSLCTWKWFGGKRNA